MAKFHNYYVLCPLIDQKSFLGVAEDKHPECVIVTLGRNVINRYRLSDQKQIGGWTSKDHITSTIIYDHDQDNYVGIFNNNSIKIWKEDLTNLDKIKKQKFPVNILKLIPRKNQSPIAIFANGNCASLSHAIETRKTYESKTVIKDSDIIVDVAYHRNEDTDFICYIIKNSKDMYEIINCPLKEELGDMESSKLSKAKITREDSYVVGEFICVPKSAVYVLWNDSKLTVYDLASKSWSDIGSVPWVSTFSSVSLAQLGKTHLIMFGSNLDQDGAILVAYNVELGVGSCKYPMKMYGENAKIYCFNKRIILEASNHIGVLPYLLEPKRNMSSLLGSHDVILDKPIEIADWGTPTHALFPVDDQVKDLLKLGLTERNICAQIITPLLEKKNVQNIIATLQKFKDIPESTLVSLLKFGISLVQRRVCDYENFKIFSNSCNKAYLKYTEELEFLNNILQLTFSDALAIPHLRNMLVIDETLFLMSYVCHLLVTLDLDIDVNFESKLYNWCILLIDAFYQQYLIMKDEKVSTVLQNTLNVVTNLIKHLETINKLMPNLSKLLAGINTIDNEEQLTYTIELMEI